MINHRFLVLLVVLWLSVGHSPYSLLAQQPNQINAIDWSPDGNYIAVQFENVIRIYKSNLDEIGIIPVRPFGKLAWSPDSSRLAFFHIDQQYFFEIRALSDLQKSSISLEVRGTGGGRISWSPAGNSVVITEIISETSANGEQTSLTTGTPIVNAGTGSIIYDLPEEPLVSPKIVAWSPDGQSIAGSDGGEQVIVWDAATGTVDKVLSAPSRAAYLVWSPDGALLAQSFSYGVALWNVENESIIRTLTPPSALGAVGSLLSWEGDLLIAEDFNAEQQILYFWQASTGELLQTMETSETPVYGLDISPDATQIVYGGIDGILHMISAPNPGHSCPDSRHPD